MKKKKPEKDNTIRREIKTTKDTDPEEYKKLIEKRRAAIAQNKQITQKYRDSK
jgi:hypothetical protein